MRAGEKGVKPGFHMIATIPDQNGSAIKAIDGFQMIVAIAAIAEWRPRVSGSNSIVRAIPQIQHGGCESSTPTWGVIMGVFRPRRRRERQRTPFQDFNRISLRLLSCSWFSCAPSFSIFPWKFVVKTVAFLYFLHKKSQVDCVLNVCAGSHLKKRERTQCILVLLLSLRSLWSLWSPESGFYMIATIAEIELKSIVVATIAVIAAIAGEWFPYDSCDLWPFFQWSQR